MKYLKLFEEHKHDSEWDYKNNPIINEFAKNARKWNLNDFIEEYIDLNDISTDKILDNISKGDKVNLTRIKRDSKGNEVYKDSIRQHIPYKTVIANKDYGSNIWNFILDNTQELKEEAIELYNKNKSNKKPKLKGKTIEAYHASPNKFDIFKYDEDKIVSQIGTNSGFFFFLNKKSAKYYASVLKDIRKKAYIYTVDVKVDNLLELNGEDIGTNWNRVSELEQASIEGYDAVIIKNADTGYGITDELVVFDDDNISIKDIQEI